MFHILITDELDQSGLTILKKATDVSFDIRLGLNQTELLKAIPTYDALIVRSSTQVDANLLSAGKKLRVIGRAGMGVDNIDIPAATMSGIIVMNTPEANIIATAELTIALMLASSRHIAAAHAALTTANWQRSPYVGTELHNKTVGVIGFGGIGRLVAKRALAFDMQVLVYDPFVSEEIGLEYGITLVDLDDLLPQADYITLHTALGTETENIINADTISQMKPDVTLINTARGKLIDENALTAALQNGRIKAAALDVFRSEPPLANNPLLSLPNVLHTPHLGANTIEAQHAVASQIANQVIDALRGTNFVNSVNMPFQVDENGYAKIQPFLLMAEKLGALHAGLAEGKVQRVELQVKGEIVNDLIRGIAAALLKGLLRDLIPTPINYINAPVLADQYGIKITQATNMNGLDYPNLITCRVITEKTKRTLAGVLFGGSEPRIVQVDQYRLEAKPEGVVLMMQNKDVPGVIGQVGTILSAFEVNIGEWRLGRNEPGGEAMSFINLDSVPSKAVLNALGEITAVTHVKLVQL